MHVAIVHNAVIPAPKYGGTERVIIWLGKQLVALGHKVTYIVPAGSSCSFADIVHLNPEISLNKIIPESVDVVHIHCGVNELPTKPYIVTLHGNTNEVYDIDRNTVFVSKNHAARFGSDVFVHNGLAVEDYGKPSFNKKKYVHFLGDAAWRVKNVKGAIHIATKAKIPLHVLGGVRFNFNQGIRLTFNPSIHFHGMVGGEQKNRLLDQSSGFLFPIRWHEPFGIAIIESLYFGCPVFATPYGSLPEIVHTEVGFLSTKSNELIEAIKNIHQFDGKKCHQYVMEHFTNVQMTNSYIKLYEKVLNGENLNKQHPKLNTPQTVKFLDFD
jgi:glycosyltransferase involved in cell wall biosynthesis